MSVHAIKRVRCMEKKVRRAAMRKLEIINGQRRRSCGTKVGSGLADRKRAGAVPQARQEACANSGADVRRRGSKGTMDLSYD